MICKCKYKINIHPCPTGNFQVLTIFVWLRVLPGAMGLSFKVRGETNNSSPFQFQHNCRTQWHTRNVNDTPRGIFFTFQSISLFGQNGSLTEIVHKATYYMVRGTLRAPLKLIWKEQSKMPSAEHKTQVGGGRQISSLEGLSCRIRSHRRMCYTIYIITSHNFRMGNEKLI